MIDKKNEEKKGTSQSLFLERCIDCGICMKKCPIGDIFSGRPSKYIKEMAKNKSALKTTSFSCTLCGYCTSVCPRGADLKSVMKEIRREDNNIAPLKIKKGLKIVYFLQKMMFSPFLTTDIVFRDGQVKSKTLFFPGCSLSSHDPQLIMSIWSYIRKKRPGAAISINCCGAPAKFVGMDHMASKQWAKLSGDIKKKGIEEIILTCPSCMENMDKIEGVKKTFLWNLMEEDGPPEMLSERPSKIELHDPCKTRYYEKTQRSIRNLLKDKIVVKEILQDGEKAICCGRGGMASIFNPKGSKDWSRSITEKCDLPIGTYCQSCVEAFGNKKAFNILYLFFRGENKKTSSFIRQLLNRYRLKKEILH